MSYAAVLAQFRTTAVPPVPTPHGTDGTGKNHKKQGDSEGSIGSIERQRRTEKKPEHVNPDILLMELAQTLQADIHRLRALLSDDDLQAIANGEHCRAYLMAYFRLMRSDGKELAGDERALSSE